MIKVTCCSKKPFLIFSIVCVLAMLAQFATPAFSAQQVGGAVTVSGGQVAAVATPQPVRLEKIMQVPDINQTNSVSQSSPMKTLDTSQDSIESCDLVRAQGKEVTLRLHYRLNPARPQPIYAGAFLYDANRQSTDAGYKPVAITAFPKGTVDVIMVLPDTDFSSDYVVTFLMESGKPVFVNGRFKMAYSWKDGILKKSTDAHMNIGGAPAATQPQSITDFCNNYAKTAVVQYNFAIANKLPDIVPPVWSNDNSHHYNWCIGVPRQNATQGTALRQNHIDQYKYLVKNNSQRLKSVEDTRLKTIPAGDKAMIIKPMPTKHLDPGLGP